MRRHRLVAVGGDDEVDVRRAPGMAPGCAQHPTDRAVGRDRVVDRPHGAYEIPAFRIGAELSPHVQPAEACILRVVKAARLRLPNIEHRAFDRLAVEIKHPAAYQGRCPGFVEVGDIAACRQLGRAEPMKRAEHRRLGGTIRFAVAHQVDDHRHTERVREEDEFLPLVAAHPAGLGQDLDRLEPLRLGQLDIFDEGVQMLDETEYDLTQPRVWGFRKSLQYLGGDVVFGLVARRRHGDSPSLRGAQIYSGKSQTWRVWSAPGVGCRRCSYFDQTAAATFWPFGLPRPVQASHPGAAAKVPLLPWVISRNAPGWL